MEDLKFNLSEKEFPKGMKILLWIFGTVFILLGFWDLYLKMNKIDEYANYRVTISSFAIGLVVLYIAFHASRKRKEHYFHVDDDTIKYRFGLFFPSHNKILWENIKCIYMPGKQKNIYVEQKSGNLISINLTWVEKKKSGLIKRHIFSVAKNKDIEIIKTYPKKK